jgi:hypothetical protein
MTATRTVRHQRLSAFLASRSDSELAELVGTGRVISIGVGGGSELIDIDSVPVFTKRIPLTDREVAHPGSTANLFDLPMFCQYGIGGPGFNAWRELAANIIVTDAVLADETRFRHGKHPFTVRSDPHRSDVNPTRGGPPGCP